MKKLLLGMLFLITGCVANNVFSPNKTILNPKCEDVLQEITVWHVENKYIIGEVCKTKYEKSGRCADTLWVYLKKKANEVYYDHQVITPPKGQCIYFSDSYTYKKGEYGGAGETIPVITFVDTYIPNPEYEKWEKEQKKSEK